MPSATVPAAPSAHRLTVPPADAGRRLDQVLAQLLGQHSRSRLQGWIEAGQVRVDDTVVTSPRHKMRGGETLFVTEGTPAPADDVAQDIPLAIVHEDGALIVVDKPAGLVVHPGSGNRDGTLLNALLHRAPELASLPRAGIVHRLDKETSGLMVVARTEVAQTDLVRQLAARTVTPPRPAPTTPRSSTASSSSTPKPPLAAPWRRSSATPHSPQRRRRSPPPSSKRSPIP